MFAFNEPYCRAGQYEHVQVTRFENVLQSTMWERPRDPDCPTSWFARRGVSNEPDIFSVDLSEFRNDKALVFAGFLVDHDGSRATGFAAAIDAAPTAINTIIDHMTNHLNLNTDPMLNRWRRGGRPIA